MMNTKLLCVMMKTKLTSFATLFSFVISVLCASSQTLFAADINAFTALRTGEVVVDGAPARRLVIEMAKPINAKLFLLDNPYRVVLDVVGADWDAGNLLPLGDLDDEGQLRYRYGQPDAQTGRLVFELSRPAAPVRAFLLPPRQAGGHRLVLDIQDRGRTAFNVAKAALKKQPYIAEVEDLDIGRTQAVSQPVAKPIAKPIAKPNDTAPKAKDEVISQGRVVSIGKPAPRPQRWVVMIDAGHGGKDPGAIGKKGTREKEVTLKAARILAQKLTATGLVTAKLTRHDDHYLKLRERINIARRAHADLFISLHADAFHKSSAKGISVFSLSDTASDKEAAYLAKSENQADLIGGPDLDGEDPVAANELLRMFQRESMNESAHVASSILMEIKDLPGGDKRGHRFAGFAVLKSPDIPSVLVEMGFLTNATDEANLRNDAYIEGLADRLQRAIITYLKQSGR